MPRFKRPNPQYIMTSGYRARSIRRNAARTIQRAFRRARAYRRNVARMSMNRTLGTNLSRRIGRYL